MSSTRTLTSRRRITVKRILGACLMIFSTLGLVVSLFGLVAVGTTSGRVAQSADDAVTEVLGALGTTSQSLGLVQSALGETQDAVHMMQSVTEGTDEGLENTGALIGSLSEGLSGDLRQVIVNTQQSLTAAQDGAEVIEEVLYGLNVISGLTGVTYDPDVSLTESFGLISESLDTVPDTLAEVDENLTAIEENLGTVEASFSDLIETLDDTEAILVEAQASVDEYDDLVQGLSLKLSDFQVTMPNAVRAATIALYFLLSWLAISQIGLLWQGWEMVSYHPAQVEERVRTLEEQVERLLRQAKTE